VPKPRHETVQLLQVGQGGVVVGFEAQRLQVGRLRLRVLAVHVQHCAQIHVTARVLKHKNKKKHSVSYFFLKELLIFGIIRGLN
jgi:hypothetical protein